MVRHPDVRPARSHNLANKKLLLLSGEQLAARSETGAAAEVAPASDPSLLSQVRHTTTSLSVPLLPRGCPWGSREGQVQGLSAAFSR